MIPRAAVIAEARTWLGTRWQHQACAKGAGVDCIHFVAGVARALGIAAAEEFFRTPAYHSYGRAPDREMLLGACDQLLHRIPLGTETVGDVLVIQFARHPMHFAFVSETAPRRLIHAWLGARRVVEHGLDANWQGRLLRAYGLPGVA